MKPTSETYAELQQAYDAFNRALFDDDLPDCLITLQREKQCHGYFSPNRFVNAFGKKIDEIALNPSYFAIVPLVEIMQSLVHEMCHQWQYRHGKPGRGRYHNLELADKMESIGLMPSSTGKPGGKRTGDTMSDYVIEGGAFLQACKELITHDFKISWYDRFSPRKATEASEACEAYNLDLSDFPQLAMNDEIELADQDEAPKNKSNRTKYTCVCNHNVWGKPNLRINCSDCEGEFKILVRST